MTHLMERQWRKLNNMLTYTDGLSWNKFGGPYIIPAKCFYCRPEPSKLDRVFVVTSTGERHVTLEQAKIR